MKRKIVSLIFSLTLCLCLIWAMAANTIAVNGIPATEDKLTRNETVTTPYSVVDARVFDTGEYTYTASATTAVIVTKTGTLYIKGTKVSSNVGTSVEIQSGGSLYIEDPNLTVNGKLYGLDVASGANVELSGGTFSGNSAAIRTADNNFGALLKKGYAFFTSSGDPIQLSNVASATKITVKECTNHSYSYTQGSGTPKHNRTCLYCGDSASLEPCTFDLSTSETANCACGNTISIAINEGNLVYDGTEKGNVAVTVTLNGNKTLVKDTDYTVSCTKRSDVGEITVTVTGKTYNGTFTKTYQVTQAQPEIKWSETTKELNYSGSPVKASDLPSVNITASSQDNLSSYVQYSYRKAGDTNFTAGLPTNAGTYEIKASLPETQNYKAAETNPCLTLTIKKIPAVKTAPTAKTLTYNREPQELATAGVLEPGAIAEGAVIEFMLSPNGSYSPTIPTGTNVSNYTVYYKVGETANYNGQSGTLSARINHKELTPTVELSYYTILYDGGEKRPTVTVKDGDAIIPATEYEVTYSNNQNVGKAIVTVSNASNGNYKITTATATFQITNKIQDALSITAKPNTVTYGDVFTLGTSGGSGNGEVTWKITSGENTVATVDANSGQITIKGAGKATVQATKSGTYNGTTNYEDAIATWSFTAAKKPVVATVTADNKTYDGNKNATVHAVVEQGVLPGDEITIDNLTGVFTDVNAGTGKTVTVNGTAQISGTNSQHYSVTLSSTSVKADIIKAPTSIPNPPKANTLTYNRTAQMLVTAGETNIATAPLEYALSENGPYSTAIPEATDAGSYEVWYRVQETSNYFGTTAEKVDVIIGKKPITTPAVTLSDDDMKTDGTTKYYIYDGTVKTPAVTVEVDGITLSSDDYSVSYSNNRNKGTATVTVTSKAGSNYSFTGTATFVIKDAPAVLTGSPQAKSLTYTGSAQELVTVGTAMNGTVVYSKTKAGTYTSSIPAEEKAGTYTVWYKVKGNEGYSNTEPQSVQVTIQPKTVVSPAITLDEDTYSYDGSEKKPNVTSVKDGTTTIPVGEYTVTYSNNINVGKATVHIVNANGGNYIVNGSIDFTITKSTATFSPDPKGNMNLPYNGTAQELVTAGGSDGGTVVYSLNQAGPYSTTIPTGTAVQEYTVHCKILGDSNHNDSTVTTLTASIIKNKVTSPQITLSSTIFRYNGSEQKPIIDVSDDNGRLIPRNEYEVTFSGTKNGGLLLVDVDTYTVTITTPNSPNYIINTNNTREFKIVPADQQTISITGMRDQVYYGNTIQLGTMGGTGNGTVEWKVEKEGETAESTISRGGLLTVKDTGPITVTATRKSTSGNYSDVSATWEFTALQKSVTAVVTADDKVYDGTENATIHVTWKDGGLISGDKIDLVGTFVDKNVGNDIGVKITVKEGDATSKNYNITLPETVTANITIGAAVLETVPTAASADLVYDTNEHALVSGGTTKNDIGKVEYRLGDDGEYSTEIPKGTNAGPYTVWYKVEGNDNYTGIAPQSISVTIAKATPTITPDPAEVTFNSEGTLSAISLEGISASVEGTFAWTNGDTTPNDGQQYEVTFTPTDEANYETVTFSVTVKQPQPDPPAGDDNGGTSSSTSSGGSSGSASSGPVQMQTNVSNGTASTTLSTASGSALVRQAAASQSKNIVIKPEITGDVSKAEVSIPASTASQIKSQTNADLTISTPIADVTIPNAALDTLSGTGGTVKTVTEQEDNTVTLTLTAGGKTVESVPGGVTLTVPVEDAGPGTVAVLVHEDGTRETIRKSVAENGELSIPLAGSATVEIVEDNSKDFSDVPEESWAADAVAFASAHELFNGTGKSTFSPDLPMSRGMLATVLYNLEGKPEQDTDTLFEDVDDDAWYASGVLWAAENGIVTGYGGSQFAPDQSITREQFAVMLWRYAGSPAADDSQPLRFTDAGAASGYAMEALRWAAANNILKGYGDGRLDPGGTATRAQAAQMLKNFMENT